METDVCDMQVASTQNYLKFVFFLGGSCLAPGRMLKFYWVKNNLTDSRACKAVCFYKDKTVWLGE